MLLNINGHGENGAEKLIISVGIRNNSISNKKLLPLV